MEKDYARLHQNCDLTANAFNNAEFKQQTHTFIPRRAHYIYECLLPTSICYASTGTVQYRRKSILILQRNQSKSKSYKFNHE